jgi:hypothetical protein
MEHATMPADERYHVQTGDTLTDRCAFGLTTAALAEFNSLHDADPIFCGTVSGLATAGATATQSIAAVEAKRPTETVLAKL